MGGEWLDAEANEPVQLQHLASGMHMVEAVCGQDSLQHKFALFSMKDTRPMEETMHWSYQTATSFRTDGKPVYLQVGSSANGVHIVYSIIAGNKLIEKGAWELGDSIVTLPFTYRPEYASGIVLNYAFIKDGKCYSRTMNIARPMPEKKLNISGKLSATGLHQTEGGMDTAHHYARRKTSQGAVDECALRQVARPVAEAYMADELRLLSVAAQLLLEEQSRREKPLCGLRQQLPHQVLSGERTAGRQL